jgi:predicted MFS family arabinose efflux permease
MRAEFRRGARSIRLTEGDAKESRMAQDSMQFTPEQILAEAQRAEAAGQFDYAIRAYRHLEAYHRGSHEGRHAEARLAALAHHAGHVLEMPRDHSAMRARRHESPPDDRLPVDDGAALAPESQTLSRQDHRAPHHQMMAGAADDPAASETVHRGTPRPSVQPITRRYGWGRSAAALIMIIGIAFMALGVMIFTTAFVAPEDIPFALSAGTAPLAGTAAIIVGLLLFLVSQMARAVFDAAEAPRYPVSRSGAGIARVDPRSRTQQVTTAVMFLALGPFAFGYFLSYFFRAVNAVVAPDLVRELGLAPDQLGLLTAAYLGAFALFQLPLGVLLDRYGPRRVQAGLLTLAAIGALLFALSTTTATLTAARALIGLGFAGGLMAGFKAVVIWVEPERRPLANSLVMSAGAIGLLVSTTPMEIAIQMYGWRTVFMMLAGVTLLSALIILLVVPERDSKPTGETLGRQIAQIGRILTDRAFWALAPVLGATAGSHIAIQTLWAGHWLRDVGGFDRTGAANVLFLMAFAFLVGILLSGTIADWFVRRGVSVLTVMFGFIVLYFASQVGIVMNLIDVPFAVPVLWFLFGMSGQVAVLAYPWLSVHFGAELSGRAHTAVNLSLFGMAFGLQYAIGAGIALFEPQPGGGYAPDAYQIVFGIVLAFQLVTMLWYVINIGAIRRSPASRTSRR